MDNINLQTKKIFLYARKSTDEPERQVLSIEAQMFELREYAKKEGLNIVREFVESKTAKEPGREIFNDMVASIEKNEAEGILAWHPDRLARNSIDGGRIIYLVDTGKITTLKFPTFWWRIPFATNYRPVVSQANDQVLFLFPQAHFSLFGRKSFPLGQFSFSAVS